MYGTQTVPKDIISSARFENDVKMYGTQTKSPMGAFDQTFENDVKMYGTQTGERWLHHRTQV